MSQETVYSITFAIYFLIIIALCFLANRYNDKLSDYVLGGRRLNGPITALAAGASDMSGWLLLALPGAVFTYGLNHIWMPVGLILGAYLNWRFVSARLRSYTEIAGNALTIPAYFENRFRDHASLLRALTAVVVLIFFTFYSAAGFVSGAELFRVAFDLNYHGALWISALIIMAYTAIGGFLALSWIDFFQGTLMFFALIITPLVTYHHLGNIHTIAQSLNDVSVGYLQPLNSISLVGIVSLIAWGFGYFGQPHILVRFMAIRSVNELPSARRICMLWMSVSLIGAVLTGLVGHAYFTSGISNAEEIFLNLAEVLFPAVITGVLFSAVLSAMMSTVSAQLLAAASAVVADFYQRFFRRQAAERELVIISRLCVFAIALIAISIAYNPEGTILELVSYAWGGLGAAFGPIVLLSLFWKRMTRNSAVVGILVGAITVIVWKLFISPVGGWFAIYEIIPGFLLNTFAIIIVSLLDKKPPIAVQAEFDQAIKHSR